jgi:DNA-binding NarL/FixJ family response regulator
MNLSYVVVEQDPVAVDDFIRLFRKNQSFRWVGWHADMVDTFRDISAARPDLTLANMKLLKGNLVEYSSKHKHTMPGSQIILLMVSAMNKEQGGTNDSMKLSPRETKVMELLAAGLRYSEIAQQLEVSYATVSTHTRHIYKKLQVSSRSKAVAKYFNHHIPANGRKVPAADDSLS